MCLTSCRLHFLLFMVHQGTVRWNKKRKQTRINEKYSHFKENIRKSKTKWIYRKITTASNKMYQNLLPSGAPEFTSSLPNFSGVRITRSLVLCVMFFRSLFVFLSFGHCILCRAIKGLWLPPWYRQTLIYNVNLLLEIVYKIMLVTAYG
jgi:hypothetical protein